MFSFLLVSCCVALWRLHACVFSTACSTSALCRLCSNPTWLIVVFVLSLSTCDDMIAEQELWRPFWSFCESIMKPDWVFLALCIIFKAWWGSHPHIHYCWIDCKVAQSLNSCVIEYNSMIQLCMHYYSCLCVVASLHGNIVHAFCWLHAPRVHCVNSAAIQHGWLLCLYCPHQLVIWLQSKSFEDPSGHFAKALWSQIGFS